MTSTCETTKTCSATFTVTTAPALTFNCPVDKTEASCQTQAAINTSYANWLATATVSGGCSPVLTNNSTGAPDKCGGAKTVTFTVTDVCSTTQTCSTTFTVTAAPPVVLTCPVNKTEDSCKTQAEVDALFATWLATASKSGGCNAVLTNNNTGAPNKCGGVKTVIFTVTSDCEANKTCTATYTMPTDHAPGITGKLDTINVNGGCSISYLPPPYTTVAELESHGLNITDCTPDANLVVSNVDLNASGNCPLNVTRVYYVTDACSNSSSSSQIITIQDTIKPTFTKPADFQMYKGNLNPDNATLVNYDFDAGTSYPTLCPILFSGITSTFNANSNTYKATSGVASGTLAFAKNINAGKGLQVDSSHQTGFWQIDLKGENLNKCTDFGVYVQAYKNATKSADTLKFQYSTNGSTWNTFRTTTLSTGTWVQDTGKITGVSNPDSLFLRVTYSGGGTGSGNKALYIDNLQVKSKVCCVYEAVPFITGDVTNENDNCATNLVATFCDSVTTEPCSGSTKIYRKWMLEDSCGNKADPQTQIITISDTSRPTFTKPADITLYNGVTIVDTHTLVHYNFNRGNNYQQLVPRLYYGIGSNVDTSTTNKFKQDTGTKTSTLAFYNDTIAGRSLRVDSSNNNGNWTFKLYGATLPICSNFEVYLQTKRSHSGSADTILYQYSLDSVNYFTFKSVPLILGSWKQDTGKIPITGAISKLFVRFKYKGGDTTYPKKLLIDNFQVQAIVNWDSCSVDPSPDVTGWPTDLKDNCDPYPSLKYEDVIEAGTCPKNYTINRTWKAIDDCQNEKKELQKITVKDTMAPTINCPMNLTLECGRSTVPDSTGYATGSDFCDTNVVVTYTDVTVPGTCPGDYTINRTWKVTDDCNNMKTCLQVIDINPKPGPFLTCPTNTTEAACQTQTTINSKFTTWKNSVTYTGGCNPVLTIGPGSAPAACGGATTVTYTVTSDCGSTTCAATFTVTNAPAVVLTCPTNQTEASCQTQSSIDSKFTTWKNSAFFTGGCNGVITNSGGSAPNHCGGSTTITFTVNSDCEGPKTCTATFTVTTAPAVTVTCPANQTEAACQSQSTIDSKFTTWKNSVTYTGGCNPVVTNNAGSAPSACGGTSTVTFTVSSDCDAPKTCTATFTVTAAPAVSLTCPTNQTEVSCQTQGTIDSKFATWKNTASFTGGCNGVLTNNAGAAPSACGGTATVTFTVTSNCEAPKTCTATFTVTNAPAVVLTCPTNQTEAACQTQSAIDTKFTTWKNTASYSGGCNAVLTNSGGSAPSACGGSTTLTFTVTSDCEAPKTCNATFTVTAAPAVTITCPPIQTEAACQTQSAIDAKFATWKNLASFTGGCNGVLSNSGGTAPNFCGCVTAMTFTVTSSCEAPKTCNTLFIVTAAPAVTITCPPIQTEAACQTQAAIDAKFATWKNSASFTGGCNGVLSNSGGTAPDHCGGVTAMTFTVTSSCEPVKTCNSIFIVTAATPITLTCPSNVTEAACQTQSAIDAKFATWKTTASFTGGCNGVITNSGGTAPNHCGGSTTVTFTVTSDCEGPKTCTATFTVDPAPPVVITCPANVTEAECQTQTAIDSKFAAWKNTASFTGGCNAFMTNSTGAAPNHCGGATTITFTVTSDCEAPKTCNATFTVTNAPAVVITCPANVTEAACQDQATIDSKFATWKNTASFSGGCGAFMTNSTGSAPNKCGGATSITFTVTSDCEAPKTCTATFTVTNAPAVVITCPANVTEAACQDQATIDSKFNTWKTTASFTGGCNGVLTNNGASAPNHCGGATTVTFTVTSDCEAPKTCTATFTVTNAPAVVITCPANVTEAACQTQSVIDSKFATWKTTASFTGGCNGALTNSGGTAPNACGGATTVTFTVTSDCEAPKTCNATFTVTNAPAVVLTCPANVTEAACQTQATIDSKFTAWKNTASFSGGCNPVFSNNGTTPPDACGGSASVTFIVISNCEAPKTCFATFTVDPAPPVVITCPPIQTEAACQTQSAIDAKFNTWKNSASFTGGCNGVLSNSGGTAPDHCGGVTAMTFTVTSSCESPKTCNSLFIVAAAPAVNLTCPANVTEAACQTQSAIDAKFATWKTTASFTGGCNGVLTNSGGTAPNHCGGTTTITFTVTSDCEPLKTCNATFTVDPAPPVVITCPANVTEAACQTQSAIDAKFATWKTTASFTGGCNGVITNSGGTAPNHCGGNTTVTFTVTSDCEGPKTCTATFTVDPAPPVVITCPANVTEAACQTQSAIDAKFATWKNTASFTGGCGAFMTNSTGSAPNHCGGSTSITFTVTSDCEAPKTCTATFTVDPAPPVVITCPANVTEVACQDQATIDSKFNTWKTTASFTGGCNGVLTNNSTSAPNHCGGTATVTFTVTSDCEAPKTCTATFTVSPAPAVAITCPANVTEVACQDQSVIDSKFNAWKTTASFTGGCNGVLTNNGASAPNHCGGTASVTFTVTSDCEAPKTCTATFTVNPAPAVVITCPANVTEVACQSQSTIDSKFNAWKTTASFTGGCNGVLSNNNPAAPSACGGVATATFTVTSDCEAPKTCTATFTVTPAPAVVITCPAPVTEAACQTQSAIDGKFATWKTTASFTGGCNGVLTNSGGTAPDHCGGTTTVTFTVTSDCEAPKTCNATFTVTPAPPVVITCPANVTEAACQTQSAIDSKFATWKTTASFTGGCNGVLTNSGGTAPDHCGGTTTVTFTVTSDCEAPKTCNATFTVTPAPPVVITCPANVTEAACQTQSAIDSKFATWKTTASFTGGCNGVLTNSGGTAPNHCGGTTTITFTVTSDCEPLKTCNATFTVDPAPPVVITCPANVTEAACQTQSAIDSKFATWKTTASFTGGCNGMLTNSGGTAPNHCGGNTTVTFTVTSDCEAPKTCTATFTVDPAPPVVITCPANVTEAACQTQSAIDAKFATWKNTASFTGGCGAFMTNSTGSAPNHCGGSTSITFTVTSDCEAPKTCTATFTVDPAPPVVITCPANVTEVACRDQSVIDSKFNAWKTTASFTGGCNGVLTNNSASAPNHCGGTATVTFTVTSDCETLRPAPQHLP
ncbi:MAG: hypothetical protein U0T81_04195 [Saprospiraceae bacterium]